MQKRTMARRPRPTPVAVVVLGWIAGLGFPATAADLDHRSRATDRSALRALDLATTEGAASAAAAPASAASGAASEHDLARVKPFAAAPAASAAASAASLSLQVGTAWEGNRHEHTWTTPFVLGLDDPTSTLHAEINGDGYTHKFGASPGDGLGDLSLLGSYNKTFGKIGLAVTPTVQLALPTGGAIGSHRSSQEASILFSEKLPHRWFFSVEPVIDRDTEDASQAPEYGKSVRVALTWKKDELADFATVFKVVRSHPAGDRDKTSLSAEHDFAIGSKLDGAVVLGRSLAGSGSTSSAELDLTWSF